MYQINYSISLEGLIKTHLKGCQALVAENDRLRRCLDRLRCVNCGAHQQLIWQIFVRERVIL